MTDFARKQLEKYGWSEGKGLGKEENGIAKPIRTKLKFDNQGIGHDSSKVFTSRWWCDVFNDASKRISVTKSETGVEIHSKKKAIESVLPSNLLIHKNFVKAEVLDDNKEQPSLKENLSDVAPDIVKDEVIYGKCEGMKKKCFNYSLMKGKINRIKRQDDNYIAKSKKKKKKSKRRKIVKEQSS